MFSETLNANEPSKVPAMDVKLKPNVEIPKSLRGRPRRQAQAHEDEIQKQVSKLLLLGLIEEIDTCDFYSQVLVSSRTIIEPDGSSTVKKRFCIDYRHLNDITDSYYWPLPVIDDILQRLNGNRVFSTIDLTMGFNQVNLTKEASRLSAFITSKGLYRYVRVPFGMKGGPAYFQRMVQDVVLRGLSPDICLVYIDDIIIFGKDQEEHARNLKTVLQRLKEFNIIVKPGKCLFGSNKVKYLGHQVDASGISISDDRKKHIASIRQPETVSELHAFIGLIGFFRKHIKNLAATASSLYPWLKKSNRTKIKWTDEMSTAFLTLRQAVMDAPILHFLKAEGDILLFTDASDVALGGHLVQRIGNEMHTVCFISKKFSDTQRRWSVTERELYAIVYCTLKLRALLGGRHFQVRTDHKTLSYWNSDNDTPKVYRWKQRLTEFDFDVVHEPGSTNNVADVLSRMTQPYHKSSKHTSSTPSVTTVASTILSVITPEIETILNEFHNDTVGHVNTLARLRAAGHKWPGMINDVKTFISKCHQCQRSTPMTRPIRGRQFQLIQSSPFKIVYVDSIGPRNGDSTYKYILVLIDGMSRYTRLFPIEDLTAEKAKTAFTTYCLQMRPNSLYFDNHKQFDNNAVADLLTNLGVKSENSVPYSHQENGLVERTIQTITRHMVNWTLKHPSEDWSSYLPTVEAILNDNPIPGSVVTPFQAVFGTLASKRKVNSLEDHVDDIDVNIQQAVDTHDRIINEALKEKDEHNSTIISKPIAPGTKVMIKNKTKSKQFNSTHFIGPFTVINQDKNTIYVSDLQRSGTIRRVHISTVKVLADDFVPTLPADQDTTQFYEVESILSHRMDSRKRPIVLVQWKNYPDPSEEAIYKNPSIRNTEAFIQYAETISELRSFIPANTQIFSQQPSQSIPPSQQPSQSKRHKAK